MPRICLTIPNATPQPYRFPLDTEVVTIGRSAANDVVVEHGSVSSHHCEMRRAKGGFILADCDSTNGIHLEENEMEVIDLKDGLDAEVGDVLFNYQLTEEEQEELSEEKFKSQQKKKKKKKAAAPAAKSSAPPRPVTPTPIVNKDTSGRDFAIFLACALVALFAFYFGLNSAHRASFPKEERRGKSLWSDKISPSEEVKPASAK
ncbi:MAG: FHA domain-containing protein [Roseibacillus sp.]